MELKILNYLYDHDDHADYAELLNAFPSVLETDGFLQMLKDSGYISGSLTAYSQVVLTPKGRAARSRLQQQEQQRKELKEDSNRKARINNWLSGIMIALSAATLAFMLLQHFCR